MDFNDYLSEIDEESEDIYNDIDKDDDKRIYIDYDLEKNEVLPIREQLELIFLMSCNLATEDQEDKLMRSLKGLSIEYARKFCDNSDYKLSFEDLVQIGMMSTYRAIYKFEESRKLYPSTFICHVVRNDMIKLTNKIRNKSKVKLKYSKGNYQEDGKEYFKRVECSLDQMKVNRDNTEIDQEIDEQEEFRISDFEFNDKMKKLHNDIGKDEESRKILSYIFDSDKLNKVKASKRSDFLDNITKETGIKKSIVTKVINKTGQTALDLGILRYFVKFGIISVDVRTENQKENEECQLR